MTRPLSVLITNAVLTGRTGTETFIRDLALGLAARGHRPMVYCPEPGTIADSLADAGIPVVRDPSAAPSRPDVVHGHHHAETVEALLAHPGVPGVFVCHDRIADTDVPPLLDRLVRYVAVDRNCLERLQAFDIPAERSAIVPNAVDLERFRPRGPLPERPARALVFGNNAGLLWSIEPITDACARRGIAVDVIGSGSTAAAAEPEALLGRYDLVFAKARCALEALAVGAAVVCCDYVGLGPLVTSANVERLREWNFGWRTLTEPHHVEQIVERIDAYDAADATRVRDFVRAHASLASSLDAYVSLYEQAIAESTGRQTPPRELARYLRTSVRALRRTNDVPPEALVPLDPAGRDAVVIDLRDAPTRVAPEAEFDALVDVTNPTSETLRTLIAYPLFLSYHWLDDATGATIEHDGLRSPIAQVAPGGSVRQRVRVRAPQAPGRFRLTVTLVYEYLAWFDAGGRCRADTVVEVTTAAGED